jgi:predicted RNA binding protein with dsRBD fold (UPF0201 family)
MARLTKEDLERDLKNTTERCKELVKQQHDIDIARQILQRRLVDKDCTIEGWKTAFVGTNMLWSIIVFILVLGWII